MPAITTRCTYLEHLHAEATVCLSIGHRCQMPDEVLRLIGRLGTSCEDLDLQAKSLETSAPKWLGPGGELDA